MKKSIFIIPAFILIACSPAPQVTVTLPPPPTETPIPTPTFHPQFTALQEKIAAAGERFVLMPDGTIQDITTGKTISGVNSITFSST